MSTSSEIKERQLTFQLAVSEIEFKNWGFFIERKGEVLYLQIKFLAPDTDSGKANLQIQSGRKWMLSEHMTKSELIQTALKAVLTAEEHEAREQFLYKNKAVFAPHFNVDVLHDLDENEAHETRTPIEKKEANGTI